MSKTPMMPVSVDLILSVANSILTGEQKEKTIAFAHDNDVVLYMFQSDINKFKEFLSRDNDIQLSNATAAIVNQEHCKDH